jgi:hypothetical protein
MRSCLTAALAFALLATVVVAAAAPAPAATPRPLATGLIDDGLRYGSEEDLYLRRIHASGARFFRTMILWWDVAPAERPADFRPADPGDPAYDWSELDRRVRLLRRHRIEPILQIMWPPDWAGGGYQPSPDPVEYAKFARAAGERYSGSFAGLPRVRYWMIWNEPNVLLFYRPQFVGEELVSPATYRTLINGAARELHAVRPDNVVITGGLSPFAVPDGDSRTAAPMRFMRDFLCMSAGRPPVPTCTERAEFDVWAHNPYTRGGPTHRATAPDDVSLGDLPRMRELLDAAVRAGHVVSRAAPKFWATEFSWDTNPPDPRGVPLRLHGRWLSEALYTMWRNGIDLVAWLELRDGPYPQNPVQGGLYLRGGQTIACDRPKEPTLSSFRFPFVAYRDGRGIRIWGRTPGGRPGRVVVERAAGGTWKPIATVRADRYGIFAGAVLRAVPPGSFRERAPQPPPAYRHAVTCDKPAAYWRLGERRGTAARDEASSNPGSYSGSPRLGVPGALSGDADTAVDLSGGGRVETTWQVWSPETVELWLRTTTAAEAAVFSNRDADGRHVFVGTSSDGRAQVIDGGPPLVSSQRVDDGRWHHLVYTHHARKGILYVDGRESASASWERLAFVAPTSIGFDASLQTYFRGAVDEVAIYYRVLSTEDVERHYRAATRPTVPGARIRGAYVRARLRGTRDSSAPFSLVRVPDRPVDPFG